jgi:hypothetical protein
MCCVMYCSMTFLVDTCKLKLTPCEEGRDGRESKGGGALARGKGESFGSAPLLLPPHPPLSTHLRMALHSSCNASKQVPQREASPPGKGGQWGRRRESRGRRKDAAEGKGREGTSPARAGASRLTVTVRWLWNARARHMPNLVSVPGQCTPHPRWPSTRAHVATRLPPSAQEASSRAPWSDSRTALRVNACKPKQKSIDGTHKTQGLRYCTAGAVCGRVVCGGRGRAQGTSGIPVHSVGRCSAASFSCTACSRVRRVWWPCSVGSNTPDATSRIVGSWGRSPAGQMHGRRQQEWERTRRLVKAQALPLPFWQASAPART